MDTPTLALAAEVLLTGVGAVLLWRLALSPGARSARTPAGLAPWGASPSDFLAFLLCIVCGAILFQVGGLRLLARAHLTSDERLILAAACFQVGMLAGIAGYQLVVSRGAGAPGGGWRRDLATGAATFAAALPILWLVTIGWQGLMNLLGLPADRQDIVDLFATTSSPVLRAVVILFAVVVAPVTEELVFRRGLFRYLRGRVPRWLAYTAPTLLFGALHVDWGTLHGLAALAPLIALGLVFSAAYERTGRVGTTIVAHALFNLNTVLLILVGVDF